ncbi:hypothetical protein ACH492_28120 [Streptomyces sp. NPDC019443]|uniref:hypothetical protein n=1 Tax=Streptomyces sp. NPDC019443 TaxID=3365061 RepID=UPI00378CE085
MHRFELECGRHILNEQWTKDVTAAEAAALVRAFVDAAVPRERAGLPPALGPGRG